MATNNSWNNGSSINNLSANSTNANLFKTTASVSTTQTLSTTTGGGNIYLCTNTSSISITLPAPSTFNINYIDFIFNGTFPVTLIAPSGIFNGVAGLTSITFPINAQSCRVFSNGTNYWILNGIYNGETLPSALTIPQPLIQGVVSGTGAASGIVGELISNVIPSGSAVSLTSGVVANMTSISLTAGDWDVWGNINFLATGTTSLGGTDGWISTSSATVPNASQYAGTNNAPIVATAGLGYCVPGIPINISTTTAVFLSVVAAFTLGAQGVCGGLYARRRR